MKKGEGEEGEGEGVKEGGRGSESAEGGGEEGGVGGGEEARIVTEVEVFEMAVWVKEEKEP